MRTRLFLALLLVSTSAIADDLGDRVRECNTIEDDAARLACYDGLIAAEATAVPAAAIVPNAEATAAPAAAVEPGAEASAPPPAPESLGAEQLRQKDRATDAEEQSLEVTATVTRCSEGADGHYLFYFGNGQVWKQVKSDRERYRDCNFNVTVTKDFFGYKMQQEGEKRRIRIKRLK